MTKDIDYRNLLLQFIASLTLADHMGDVGDDVDYILEKLGIQYDRDGESDYWQGLAKTLHQMGVTTLYETEVYSEDDDA